ncbi:glycosyltransferase [Nitratireductor aquibiodomus RA22]|uniref:Glycosyltransferase n=1 Tax=Nitratireductor aquibiodomus RA22 TaxID=1189611 RepID=I5BV68_9HYPH|nr:glycosyltransferase [Nitratireductor aquibiodomus]EIM73470.1 glycosyltransferase [Nitratireductor aquibiodomus RA22]
MIKPILTVAVPSYNHGEFLDFALESIFMQDVPVEVFVMDGGSTDDTCQVIKKWEPHLAGWRSHVDDGQSAAINEGIALGSAPFVTWLNSDDYYLPNGLKVLIAALEAKPDAPVAYGRAFHEKAETAKRRAAWVQPFTAKTLALRCIICQPAALIRRSAWESVSGTDPSLHMTMDYDLWWRLYRHSGDFVFVDHPVAINRDHASTKTNENRKLHYSEAISTVRTHYGSVPLKWYLYQPYAVWWKSIVGSLRRYRIK